MDFLAFRTCYPKIIFRMSHKQMKIGRTVVWYKDIGLRMHHRNGRRRCMNAHHACAPLELYAGAKEIVGAFLTVGKPSVSEMLRSSS